MCLWENINFTEWAYGLTNILQNVAKYKQKFYRMCGQTNILHNVPMGKQTSYAMSLFLTNILYNAPTSKCTFYEMSILDNKYFTKCIYK